MRQRRAQVGLVYRGVVREGAGGFARFEQIADTAAAPDASRIDIVHGLVSLVPDHQPVLRIEHAQALNHIVERDVELAIVLAEPLLEPQRHQHPDHADRHYNSDKEEGIVDQLLDRIPCAAIQLLARENEPGRVPMV